jgi:tetrahydromethanopterin S-methyltransferase subunit G
MPDSQSRTSETQIVVLQKDIEHLKYVIDELEKECEFVKSHFTTKNNERLDDIKLIHGRMDKHLQSDLDFHETVRKKISCRFDILDNRIRHLERWKWAAWGGMVIVGTLLGWFYTGGKTTWSLFGG